MGSLGYLRDVRVLSNRASRDVSVARALIDSLREAVVDMSSEEENEVVRKIDQVADKILDLSQVCDVTLRVVVRNDPSVCCDSWSLFWMSL